LSWRTEEITGWKPSPLKGDHAGLEKD